MEITKAENALRYAALGWHVFPCHSIQDSRCTCGVVDCDKPGKHPRTKNGFNSATTDETIIRNLWAIWPDANIGCATGAISGIVILDLDAKHERTSKEFEIPTTVCARSAGISEYFVFKHPGGHAKSTDGQILGPGVDIKADDGYVILPPSSHVGGNCYEWIMEPGDVEISEMPEWLRVAFDKLRQVWESASKYDSDGISKDKSRRSQAEMLLEIIERKENVTLFHDDKKDGYISVAISDHQEIMSLKSKTLRRWLTKEFHEAYKKAIPYESIRSAIAVLEGKACFDGKLHSLENRLAWHGEDLWYDLTNESWQAIKVNKDGWRVESSVPILFNRYSHNQAQVIPVKKGDVRLILKYINITDPEQQLLLLVYLISCFIPDFPHPILVIFGPQGSGKTGLSKIFRRISDPSLVEVASMPSNLKDLVQTIAHHTFLFFDNVSYISEEVSDTLCKAITGSGFVKRELYTDDEDIIYNFKRCIGINGINLVATRPDLLDRSLLIELERIDDSQRKQEKELKDDFETDLPLILGGVFDAVSKALRIKPDIKISAFPRMADFALWGCAIAEGLGYKGEDFLKAYQNNISKQTETILSENMLAMVLISFMEDRGWERWEGTASQLLKELGNRAGFENVNTYEKYWPKAPQALTRALNILKITLRSAGVSIITAPGQKRKVIIERMSSLKDNSTLPPEVVSSPPAKSDTDDIGGKSC